MRFSNKNQFFPSMVEFRGRRSRLLQINAQTTGWFIVQQRDIHFLLLLKQGKMQARSLHLLVVVARQELLLLRRRRRGGRVRLNVLYEGLGALRDLGRELDFVEAH